MEDIDVELSQLADLAHIQIGRREKRPLCNRCRRPVGVCWCRGLGMRRVKTGCRVVVLQHPHEEKRCLRTAPILQAALPPHAYLEIKAKTFPFSRFPQLEDILTSPMSVLMYPGQHATSLDTLPPVGPCQPSYNIIIIDGTWQQAKSMYHNCRHLHNLPQVCLSGQYVSKYVIRTQPTEDALSTVETAAIALATLEQDWSIYNTLLRPLQLLCQYQIKHGAVPHQSKEQMIASGRCHKAMGKRTVKKLRKCGARQTEGITVSSLQLQRDASVDMDGNEEKRKGNGVVKDGEEEDSEARASSEEKYEEDSLVRIDFEERGEGDGLDRKNDKEREKVNIEVGVSDERGKRSEMKDDNGILVRDYNNIRDEGIHVSNGDGYIVVNDNSDNITCGKRSSEAEGCVSGSGQGGCQEGEICDVSEGNSVVESCGRGNWIRERFAVEDGGSSVATGYRYIWNEVCAEEKGNRENKIKDSTKRCKEERRNCKESCNKMINSDKEHQQEHSEVNNSKTCKEHKCKQIELSDCCSIPPISQRDFCASENSRLSQEVKPDVTDDLR